MKNTVGQVPRGDSFFPREELIDKIYRKLDANAHLYLAAPRRMGKTAIMRHLEDHPRSGYEFHYLITESIDRPETYLDELTKTLQRFKTWSARTAQIVKEWIPKLRFSLSESESEAGLVWEQNRDPFKKFKEFVRQLETNGNKVVVMIDEFPQTIANISRKQGADSARQFLQFNREIRQLANSNLRFIITGSIGLYAITEKLEATNTINDLSTLEIPFLSQLQATTLVTQLLDEAKIAYQPNTCNELLQRIGSYHPFYLQLLVQEIIDEFESTGKMIDSPAIDRSFNKILQRRNDHCYSHYYQRLKGVFAEKDYALAIAILNALATQEHGLDSEHIQTLAAHHGVDNFHFILRSLEFDGYLFASNPAAPIYRFTSPILREWWKLRVIGS